MKKTKETTEVWIILDPEDSPHTFLSEEKALKTWRTWHTIAKQDPTDSFWKMTKPERYTKG